MWVVIRIKDALARGILTSHYDFHGDEGVSQLRQVIAPLSETLTWVMVTGGVAMAFLVLGINMRPVLTLLGGSSIVVGVAAQ